MKGGGEGRVRRDEKRAPLKTPAWEARETAEIEPIQDQFSRICRREKSASRGLWVRDRLFLVPVSFTLTGKMADEFLRYCTF